MLQRYYKKNTTADATSTMLSSKNGIIVNVIMFNDNENPNVVSLKSSQGMIFFRKELEPSETYIIKLESLVQEEESIEFYSQLEEAHCSINFLLDD